MRTISLFALIVCFSLTLWGTDNFTPLNVKLGLWEMTMTNSMSGMPAMPAIPPDALAKMPPEQRARMEAMMKGGMGGPTVIKECITKEKLEKNSAFNANRGECTHTVVSSTGSKLEMKVHCQEKLSSTDATVVVEAIGSDNVKGTMHSVTNADGKTMNMNFTFSSKYLGPACGDVK